MTGRIGESAQTASPLPLASSYDIQKRLVRGGAFSQLKPEPRGAGGVVATKRKLEDYLDPVILADISAKIGGAKKDDASQRRKMKREEVEEFDWPAEELKVLGTEMRENVENIEAVDIGCEFDGDERV